MILKGNVFKYGDHVDTDVIIPAQYLTTADPKELAKNCMADIDINFAKEVKLVISLLQASTLAVVHLVSTHH